MLLDHSSPPSSPSNNLSTNLPSSFFLTHSSPPIPIPNPSINSLSPLFQKINHLQLSIDALQASNLAIQRTQSLHAQQLHALRARLSNIHPHPTHSHPPLPHLSFSLADHLRPLLNSCFPCFQAPPRSPDSETDFNHPPHNALLADYDGHPSSLDHNLFRPHQLPHHSHPDLISLHSGLGSHLHPNPYHQEPSSTLSRWELLGSWLATTLCPSRSHSRRLLLDDSSQTALDPNDNTPLFDELALFARPSGQTHPPQSQLSQSLPKPLLPTRSLELVSPQYVRSTAPLDQPSPTPEHPKKRTRTHSHRPPRSGRTGSTAGSESTSSVPCPAKKRSRGAHKKVVASNCSLAFPAMGLRRRSSSTSSQLAYDIPSPSALSSAMVGHPPVTNLSARIENIDFRRDASPERVSGPSLASQTVKGPRAVVVQLVLVALAVRLGTLFLLVLLPRLGLVPCFDCSARIRHLSLEGLVRWDSLHFLAMGSAGGRQVEQDWAFGRGVVWVVRLGEWLLRWSGATEAKRMVIGAALAACLASVGSSVVLFLLTFKLTRSLRFATLVGYLHVFSPSPSTQVVPYTEPFYGLLSFGGTYAFVCSSAPRNSSWKSRVGLKVVAAGLAGLATAMRPIGVLQSVVWVAEWWGSSGRVLVLSWWYQDKKVNLQKIVFKLMISLIEPVLLSLVTCGPFLGDQFSGYLEYCSIGGVEAKKMKREWCLNWVPSIYNFVQRHYWDVGFLRYWRLSQSPLFIISLPMYYVLIKSLTRYYEYNFTRRSKRMKKLKSSFENEKEKVEVEVERPFMEMRLVGQVHLQFVLTVILMFNSHVQIILRQAATMPVFWWGLADMIGCKWGWWKGGNCDDGGVEKEGNENGIYKGIVQVGISQKINNHNDDGHWWFDWVLKWGICSLVLWIGFYPPA